MMEFIKKIIAVFKKDIMLAVAVAAAIVSFFITPPDISLIYNIDWKTLATLFMLLLVLEGFKSEELFLPVIRLAGKFKNRLSLGFFLVFGVFFSSMFVTNDVSLIIFVPLTILLFQGADMEEMILPILTLENIAAVRGSLLTPFGSPQNLFLFSQSGISFPEFLKMMLPLWIMSIILLIIFLFFIYRKNRKQELKISYDPKQQWGPERKKQRILYLVLFVIVVAMIISRTTLWPYITLALVIALAIADRKIFVKVDYALILTFLCFFIFSSSIAGNDTIAGFLSRSVAGNEYLWSLAISQLISNVPASIVLWPFTADLRALIYGLDSAGLVTVIGSLASVINLRLYTKSYPGQGGKFMKTFEMISIIFFLCVFPLQLLIMNLI